MDFYNFLAEDQLVEIVPKFVYDRKLCLICGEFGPFTPQVRTQVPLWLAINLRKQQKCEIIIPDWVKQLKQKIEMEEQQPLQAGEQEEEIDNLKLDEMPENWREIIKLLEADLAVNFKSLIDRREAILKISVHELFKYALESESLSMNDVTVHNITKSELYLIKDVVQRSFAIFQKLRQLNPNPRVAE